MRRVLVSALVAGLLAGLVFFTLQLATLLPLIATAESYERAAAATHAPETHAWEPRDGAERLAYTAAADMVASIGFALLLVGSFGLRSGAIGFWRGLAWGLAGYAVFALAPGLGLPPTPPGMAEADLAPRQLWWLGTALSTAAGLGLLAFGRGWWRWAVGLLLLALPHAIGAPRPDSAGGVAPAELASRFAIASLVATGVFWVVLGATGGWLYDRLGQRRDGALDVGSEG